MKRLGISVAFMSCLCAAFAAENAVEFSAAEPYTRAASGSIEKVTISRNDDIHECFPSLCKTASGRLVLAYRESDEHQPRKFTRLVVRYSDDQGASWSPRHVLVATETSEPDTLVKYNCPKVQQWKDGRLLYLCDTFVNDLSKQGYDRYREACIAFWFSDDNGATWSEEIRSGVGGVMPDEVVELNDGTWLLATHLPDPETGFLVQHVTRSLDGGTTWEPPIVIAAREGFNFCEASILQCSDGLVICYMRENSFVGRPVYKSFSTDSGKTWDGPYETLMGSGHRPVAHFTSNGDVLTTYRYYPGRGARLRNTFVSLESEKSAREKDRAKQSARIRPLDYDASPRPDSGYTGWVELKDGRFFAVNYIRDNAPMAQIRGYRFQREAFEMKPGQ